MTSLVSYDEGVTSLVSYDAGVDELLSWSTAFSCNGLLINYNATPMPWCNLSPSDVEENPNYPTPS